MGNVDGSPTRTRNRIARLAALALAPMMLVIDGGDAVGAASGDCTSAGGTVTCTYTTTGAAQTFTVPSWVNTIHVVARGAAEQRCGSARLPEMVARSSSAIGFTEAMRSLAASI